MNLQEIYIAYCICIMTDLSAWSWVFGHRVCYVGHCKCVLTINFQLPLINRGGGCFVISSALPTIFGGCVTDIWNTSSPQKPIEDWLIGLPIDLVIGNLDLNVTWIVDMWKGNCKSLPTKTVDGFVHCRPSNHLIGPLFIPILSEAVSNWFLGTL